VGDRFYSIGLRAVGCIAGGWTKQLRAGAEAPCSSAACEKAGKFGWISTACGKKRLSLQRVQPSGPYCYWRALPLPTVGHRLSGPYYYWRALPLPTVGNRLAPFAAGVTLSRFSVVRLLSQRSEQCSAVCGNPHSQTNSVPSSVSPCQSCTAAQQHCDAKQLNRQCILGSSHCYAVGSGSY
jgi:hypothetical protein